MCFGPGCRDIQAAADGCEKDWWRNLLYINNFFEDGAIPAAQVSLLSNCNTVSPSISSAKNGMT